MDCFAFCTASSYQIKPLYEEMRTRYKTSLYRDVVHVRMDASIERADLFVFPYGSIVCFGLQKEKALQFLKELNPFEQQPKEELESDEFTYVYGNVAKVVDDEIVFPDEEILSKLAASHAIAQSVKLGTFETAIQKTFNNTKYLPENLALYGKIPLSRKDIRRKIGELFIERSSINLHLDILDTPEFFWEHTELEPIYRMMAFYLDNNTRVEILNQRLNVIHELFEMLGTELNHQHSSRLEWTIIFLIVIEVILTLAKDWFKLI